MNFNALIKEIETRQWDVYGMEVYENGRLTHSYGDTLDSGFPIYSATKSIISIAAGIALDQGKIELERSILEYLPAGATGQMSESQDRKSVV